MRDHLARAGSRLLALLASIALTAGLTACLHDTEYAAQIQRTEFGIPHIKARDY